MIVHLYKKNGSKIEFVPTFDSKKTEASRGSLKLVVAAGNGTTLFNQTEVFPSNKKSHFFQIANTAFFLRIFILRYDGKISADEPPFLELSPLKIVSFPSNTPTEIQRNRQREYARLCLLGVLNFDSKHDRRIYGNAFISVIEKKLEEIFSAQMYLEQTEEEKQKRRAKTIPDTNPEGTKKLAGMVKKRNKIALSEQEGVDLLYRRATYAGRNIKLLGKTISPTDEGASEKYPNFILFLRTYDRDHPRALRTIDKEPFHGYAHNVAFALPHQQVEDMKAYLNTLRNLGREQYRERTQGEIYGENWSFKAHHHGYKNFSETLDAEFWKILADKKGVDNLMSFLRSSVGDDSTSASDSIFYYGSSQYRMPFRREGGLERLHKLEQIYNNLPEADKYSFGYKHLKSEIALKADCLRVVVFFYITRMLGPRCIDQHNQWTKLHLFPLDIAGAVVGSIGCISYERKIMDAVGLPVDDATWNQEYYFFTEIVSSFQRTLRQQYRDFQMQQLTDVFRTGLEDLIENAHQGLVTLDAVNELKHALNLESRLLARVCPYPAYEFQLYEPSHEQKSSRKNGTGSVKIKIGTALILEFDFNFELNVFRSLQKNLTGFEHVLAENKHLLELKLTEQIKILLS